jgi:PadR family transcriptional regulator, regulatory protein PadR
MSGVGLLLVNADTMRGHLDALILAVLEQGPLHGYAVMEALRRRSGGALDLPTGTVYPALRRLERAGWIDGAWSTVGGRKRRTYALSRAGRRELAARRSDWIRFSGVVGSVLGGTT